MPRPPDFIDTNDDGPRRIDAGEADHNDEKQKDAAAESEGEETRVQ